MDDDDKHMADAHAAHARYAVKGEPIFVNNCHCRQCQQQTGSTSVVNMFYEADRLTLLSGEISRHVVKAGQRGEIMSSCAAPPAARRCGAIIRALASMARVSVSGHAGRSKQHQAPDAVIYAVREDGLGWHAASGYSRLRRNIAPPNCSHRSGSRG
jgi:hypothetical protein